MLSQDQEMPSKVLFSSQCTFRATALQWKWYLWFLCLHKAKLHVVNFYLLSHSHLNNSFKDLQYIFQYFNASGQAPTHSTFLKQSQKNLQLCYFFFFAKAAFTSATDICLLGPLNLPTSVRLYLSIYFFSPWLWIAPSHQKMYLYFLLL